MATVDARRITRRLAKRVDKAAAANQEFVWLTLEEARALLTQEKPPVEAANAKSPTATERAEPASQAEVAGECTGCPHPLSEHGALGCKRCKCDRQPFANHAGE